MSSFFGLQLLSRGLIMWDSIHPSTDWVESHIPEVNLAALVSFIDRFWLS